MVIRWFWKWYVFLSDQIKEQLYANRKNHKITQAPSSNKNYLSLCFEPGHLDSLNFGTLNQGLLYLQSLGMDYIETSTQQICRAARNIFHARGFIPDWMYDRREQSTIMNLPLEAKTIDQLKTAGILSSLRGNGLRISFHFYNTQHDLDRFLEILNQK